MAMSELHQQIHAALFAIKLNGPKNPCLGICNNVTEFLADELSDEIEEILTELFSDWPDKSHNTAYPIGNWTREPSKLFWQFHDDHRSMWEHKSKYGAARWALLEHCINKLSQHA